MTWPTMWDDDPSAIIEARYTAGGVVWKTSLDWSTRPENHDDERDEPFTEDVSDLKAMPYRQYLKSAHWRQTRRRALIRAGFHCRGCGAWGSKSRLEVHHLTYERRGCEYDSDLVALCRDCHQSMHDILPTNREGR